MILKSYYNVLLVDEHSKYKYSQRDFYLKSNHRNLDMFDDNIFLKFSNLRIIQIHRIIIIQCLITVCLTCMMLPIGKYEAISILSGCLTSSIPNSFLIWKVFHCQNNNTAQRIIKSFYQGEAGKFILTIVTFVLIFTLLPSINPLILISAFILMQVINWLTFLLIND